MSTEDRVKVLEGEFKLIKSELRQTLGSVRDFMLDLKLPPVQEDVNQKAMDLAAATTENADKKDEDNQGNTGDDFGNGAGNDANSGAGGSGANGMGEESAFSEAAPDLSDTGQAGGVSPGSDGNGEPMSEMEDPLDFIDGDRGESDGVSSGEMPGQPNNNQAQGGEEASGPVKLEESKPSTPPINMLANLIRWVAVAKRDIGMAQLPVFLDVYASSGNLNTEMKDIILHLAEVAAGQQDNELPAKKRTVSEQLMLCLEINGLSGQLPDEIKQKVQRLTQVILEQSLNAGQADIWSQLLLELHGVLSGYGNCVKPFQILQAEALAAEAKAAEEAEEDAENHTDLSDDEEIDLVDEDEDELLCLEETRSQTLKGTKPAKLRLIMPMGDGAEQELDLGNLFIATDKIGRSSKPEVKSAHSKKKVISRGKAWL